MRYRGHFLRMVHSVLSIGSIQGSLLPSESYRPFFALNDAVATWVSDGCQIKKFPYNDCFCVPSIDAGTLIMR